MVVALSYSLTGGRMPIDHQFGACHYSPAVDQFACREEFGAAVTGDACSFVAAAVAAV